MSSDERMREMPKDGADGNPAPGDEGQACCTPAADTPMERRSITLVKHGTEFAQTMRLCTAADLGQVIKPFVCMEHEQLSPYERPGGRLRPFSGMAVLTLVLSGAAEFEDTTGNKGRLAAGGVAWLMSGRGVWQAAARQSQEITRIFRIGIALRSSAEDVIARSRYIVPSEVPHEGPVRAILGRLGSMVGTLHEPENINVFHVRLHRGQRWHYSPPLGHTFSWIAVDRGRLRVQHPLSSDAIQSGELAVFEESSGSLRVHSEGATSFVFGSSKTHPYPLVFDRFSVHTTHDAMSRAKGEIARVGRELLAQGRIP
jgi:redox-sensitive bicupin YhaK (pirin superfamily)